MNWKIWLHGLAAAAIGGSATGATQALGSGASLKGTGLTAAAGALVAVLGYFLKSPIFQQAVAPEASPKQ